MFSILPPIVLFFRFQRYITSNVMAAGIKGVSINGSEFHMPTCRTLPAPKNQVEFDTRDAAIKKGYVPCKNCDP